MKKIRLSPGGIIKGNVVFKETGKPVGKGLNINFQKQIGGWAHGAATTKEDGSFETDGLKPGQYQVIVFMATPEWEKFVTSPDITVNAVAGTTSELTIEIEEGIMVKGSIIDESTGKPKSEGFSVMAYEGSTRNIPLKGVAVKEDGLWEMYLPEGEITLMYYGSGLQSPQEFKKIQVSRDMPLEDLVIKVPSK
jgi:hypothetical protein